MHVGRDMLTVSVESLSAVRIGIPFPVQKSQFRGWGGATAFNLHVDRDMVTVSAES